MYHDGLNFIDHYRDMRPFIEHFLLKLIKLNSGGVTQYQRIKMNSPKQEIIIQYTLTVQIAITCFGFKKRILFLKVLLVQ